MTELATYSRSGPAGTIVMDDGKANVMSVAMLMALRAGPRPEWGGVHPPWRYRGQLWMKGL
jgi:hypothetical protein